MKISMVKMPGGSLTPASDIESEKMTRFKNVELYEVDIKLSRNIGFHRMTFKFFNHCFAYWNDINEYIEERTSFDMFRKEMIVLAGYRNVYHTIDGGVRVEAKSISFSAMSQDEFEALYKALIRVAVSKIFVNCDIETEQKLLRFF